MKSLRRTDPQPLQPDLPQKPRSRSTSVAPAAFRSHGPGHDPGHSAFQAAIETRSRLFRTRLSPAIAFPRLEPWPAMIVGIVMLLSSVALDGPAGAPGLRAGILGGLTGLLGLGISTRGNGLREFMEDRIRAEADLHRATRLPVLAALKPLHKMNAMARQQWALQTWSALQSRLDRTPGQGYLCGIVSSRPMEGCSTLIHLLASAAYQCRFQILTVNTRTDPSPPSRAESNSHPSHHVDSPLTSDPSHPGDGFPNALTHPEHITQKLSQSSPVSFLHLNLAGIYWDPQRIRRWTTALKQWKRIQRLVILVELPPGSAPETLFLAEPLLNLIWLAEGRRSFAGDIRTQLELFRHARCHVAGAVFNHHAGLSHP